VRAAMGTTDKSYRIPGGTCETIKMKFFKKKKKKNDRIGYYTVTETIAVSAPLLFTVRSRYLFERDRTLAIFSNAGKSFRLRGVSKPSIKSWFGNRSRELLKRVRMIISRTRTGNFSSFYA
jgi:hypothetical protein